MATFSVRFLGCKVSHSDAHAIREALLRDGHEEGRGAEIAVVNTCCVTNEAVRKSRQAASRAARTHRRVYVTGCGANLERAFTGLPENVTVVARRAEDTAAFVAGDVGDRTRPMRGSCACIRAPQDGCGFSCRFCDSLVRGAAQPQRRRGPTRSVHGGSFLMGITRVFPRPCGLHACEAGARGRGDAGATAPSPVLDRGQPRQRRARACAS